MIRPIEMKCTQEQFDSIKELFKNDIECLDTFVECEYLVNNIGGRFGKISNVTIAGKHSENREVHEEWNAQIFLEACGINNVGRYDIYQEIGALMDKAKKQGINIKIII